MNREDKLLLLSRYLDDALASGEQELVEKHLRTDPEFRECLHDLSLQDVHLRRLAKISIPKSAPRHRGMWWTAAAAALLVGLGWYFLHTPAPRTPPPSFLARVDSVEGEAWVLTKSGKKPALGQKLDVDDTVQTVGRESSAAVVYPDSTRVDLGPDSSIRLLSAGLHLTHGVLNAEVVRQKSGRPFVFSTPHAKVDVLGTSLSLALAPEFTRTEVHEGLVRMTREQDGASLEVPAGNFAMAGARIDMKASPVPAHPKMTALGAGVKSGPFELSGDGFVNHWLVVGPYPNPGKRPDNKGFHIDYLGGEAGHVPTAGMQIGAAQWFPHASKDDIVNLFFVKHLKVAEWTPNILIYGACWLECADDADVEIRMGSDDGYKLWIDRQPAAVVHQYREYIRDQDRHPVKLAKGLHLVLLKVDQDWGFFQFSFRVVTPNGQRARGIKVWN